MKTLNFFRKPYLTYAITFMFLFVSCKQYDNDTEPNKFELDLKKFYAVNEQVSNLVNFNINMNYKDIKIQVIKNQKLLKSSSTHFFTETEIEEAGMLLKQFNIINENGDFNQNLTPSEAISNIADYGYSQLLFSSDTKDFLKSDFINAIDNDQVGVVIDNFISSHPLLTASELNMLYALLDIYYNNQNKGHVGCWFVGLAAGALITAVSDGWLGFFASSVAATVEQDVCEAIVAYAQ